MQKAEKEKSKKGKIIFTLAIFLMTITGIVLGILCFGGSTKSFIKEQFLLFSILFSILMTLLCGLSIWFIWTDKEALSKSVLGVYLLIVLSLLLILILQRTGFFQVIKDADSLHEYLKSSGRWMPIVYIILQYLQVIILPIPGIVSTVAGVALFGPFYALLYSLIGIILGSFTAFWIGRKLGYKVVAWIVGREALRKWQKKLKGKDNLFLTIMFILPMFPDDILCFTAGLSSMTTKYFLIMITFSRLIAIAGTCYSFNFIPWNTWWGLLIWAVFILFVVTVFIIAYKNIDKIQQRFGKYFKVFPKNKK